MSTYFRPRLYERWLVGVMEIMSEGGEKIISLGSLYIGVADKNNNFILST